MALSLSLSLWSYQKYSQERGCIRDFFPGWLGEDREDDEEPNDVDDYLMMIMMNKVKKLLL